MGCISKNTIEYGDLKRSSTLSSEMLDTHCMVFFEEHNRLPRLDEIPGTDSSKYLHEELKVNQYNGVKKERLLEFTGAQNIEDAVINLNNHYVDSEVSAIDLGDSALIKIQQRPTTIPKELETIYEPDAEPDNSVIISGLNKLRDLYGYDFKEITNFDLEQEEWQNIMPANKTVNAFIYNGNIYINTDNMSPDSKVHEMLHLLVGSIRFANPSLYQQLLQQAVEIPNLDQLIVTKYPDKTQNDAIEEVLVTELAKKLTGMPSALDSVNKEQLYEINYNIKRILDTLLFGDYSTKTISDDRLISMSLKEVAAEVNSSTMTNKFFGTYNFKGSEIHRKLSNLKSDLLRKQDLVEICD